MGTIYNQLNKKFDLNNVENLQEIIEKIKKEIALNIFDSKPSILVKKILESAFMEKNKIKFKEEF